jgi:hypothetical protein
MTTATTTQHRPGTERAIAAVTAAAPVAVGILTPFLDGDATTVLAGTYVAASALTISNAMNLIPADLAEQLPASDVLKAHKATLFGSTLTTGLALAMGSFAGGPGADALMLGWLHTASNPIPGIVSLGWWAATLLVPYKLRRILWPTRARKTAQPARPQRPAQHPAMPALPPDVHDILAKWGQHISPDTGTHKGQVLHVTHFVPGRYWKGTITATTPGAPVTVTPETVSGVYRKPAEWIHINTGAHAGERHITVNLTAPPELDTSTLQGAWRKWAARSGGIMADTHLENVQDDPNTGGQVAVVVAGENLDKLPVPDRASLAGALRTKPLLISYELRQDPRQAVIRKMDRNPLQDGAEFPGLHVLKPNANGYIQIGPGISGFPARIQLHDPKLGGQHVIVAGVTGSGKGGTLQLIALAHHTSGSAIIYADPKGSSNPAITKMAAYSGLGEDAAMGALRIWYHGLMRRIEASARAEMKNFKPAKDRPWAPLIFDEASTLLTSATYKKEAVHIIKDGAKKGRSLGMPIVLANQILQLAELGGESAIRDNMFYGGSLILLRSDSSQKHLVDLPDTFAGCNPADIPPAWAEDRALVFDPNTPQNDPIRTFGLNFCAAPGAHAEMSRTWILEDATPYIEQDNVGIPHDWPFWEDRHELAQISVLPDGEGNEDDDYEGGSAGTFLTGLDIGPKKPASADDKILTALKDVADPMGLESIYLDKPTITRITSVEGSTLDNALSRLATNGKIHRQIKDGKEIRGMYAHGPRPITPTDETDNGDATT